MDLLEEIKKIYLKNGKEMYIGDPLTTMEHMLQAAIRAENLGCSNEIIIAAFFHDIGHFLDKDSMKGYGVSNHEDLGYYFLKSKGFPDKIAKLVQNHVKAKKYLVSKSSDYYQNLSEASKITLKFQGGFMDEPEMKIFEQDLYFEASIQLRKLDDKSKDPNFFSNLKHDLEYYLDKYLFLSLIYVN